MNKKPTHNPNSANYSGGGADPGRLDELLDWFERLKLQLPPLPFNETKRNGSLRHDIVIRLLGQLLTDDERARLMGLPSGCRIREGAKILSPENLSIGEYCWIGENAVLDASGGLTIGPHCSIGLSVFIWSHSSHLTNLTLNNKSGSDLIKRKPVKIGSGCFIAGPSVVLPGVTIGDKVLIRPFSVIEKDIPSRSIVDGKEVVQNALPEALIEKLLKKQIRQTNFAKRT